MQFLSSTIPTSTTVVYQNYDNVHRVVQVVDRFDVVDTICSAPPGTHISFNLSAAIGDKLYIKFNTKEYFVEHWVNSKEVFNSQAPDSNFYDNDCIVSIDNDLLFRTASHLATVGEYLTIHVMTNGKVEFSTTKTNSSKKRVTWFDDDAKKRANKHIKIGSEELRNLLTKKKASAPIAVDSDVPPPPKTSTHLASRAIGKKCTHSTWDINEVGRMDINGGVRAKKKAAGTNDDPYAFGSADLDVSQSVFRPYRGNSGNFCDRDNFSETITIYDSQERPVDATETIDLTKDSVEERVASTGSLRITINVSAKKYERDNKELTVNVDLDEATAYLIDANRLRKMAFAIESDFGYCNLMVTSKELHIHRIGTRSGNKMTILTINREAFHEYECQIEKKWAVSTNMLKQVLSGGDIYHDVLISIDYDQDGPFLQTEYIARMNNPRIQEPSEWMKLALGFKSKRRIHLSYELQHIPETVPEPEYK
ncbi:Oidioi.mRNA.OKI2018_I69.PAR.g8531.t1.cds [Oikopleura dioica]|uniref:Oidioi.mRNA.OKI2018_I69.PAR.g8531.t1.cds n=1 Tax=Oikopleura dioica TaxID=34765 RepID=A0ABN7RLU8_OIKDI|nr:Oidioi.mRNA.OKI2018_I69.PAR.g8531.t1.cds [Oikopleura dioica]